MARHYYLLLRVIINRSPPKLPLVLIIGIPCKASEHHDLSIVKAAIEVLRVLEDGIQRVG